MTSLFSRNRARPPCRGTTAACMSTVAIGLEGVVGLLVRYSQILWTIVRFSAVHGCINRSINETDKRFFIIPAIIIHSNQKDKRAEKGRRDKWLLVIKKQDLTEDKIRHAQLSALITSFLVRWQGCSWQWSFTSSSATCWRASCASSMCASPTAAVPDLLTFRVQAAAAAAALKPVSLFRRKAFRPLRSINYTTWRTELTKPCHPSRPHPSRQFLSPTLPSAAASAGNNTLSRTCISHASVRRALPSRAATHNAVTRTGTYFRRAILTLQSVSLPSGLRPRN